MEAAIDDSNDSMILDLNETLNGRVADKAVSHIQDAAVSLAEARDSLAGLSLPDVVAQMNVLIVQLDLMITDLGFRSLAAYTRTLRPQPTRPGSHWTA